MFNWHGGMSLETILSPHERGRPTFYCLSNLWDERLSDVAVTVHGDYKDEDAKTYKLHRVILSGKTLLYL